MQSKKHSRRGTGPRRRTHGGGRHNRLRIIGGTWRSRVLSFPPEAELRPSGDRIREMLFNWLAPILPGSRCLDLFAGSGALGLEALSRGAASVTMVEHNESAVENLRRNCALLEADHATVVHGDALGWLQSVTGKMRYDLVFLDPPFAGGLLEPACALLDSNDLLSPEAYIYIECAADTSPAIPSNWEMMRQKFTGQVQSVLYKRH